MTLVLIVRTNFGLCENRLFIRVAKSLVDCRGTVPDIGFDGYR